MDPQGFEETEELRRWAGRRRGYGVAAGLSVAFGLVVMEELDHPVFVIDDVLVLVVGLAILALYAAMRRASSVNDLKAQVNLFAAMLILAYAVKLAWIFVERGDPDAFGDDLSSIFLLITVIANRFL